MFIKMQRLAAKFSEEKHNMTGCFLLNFSIFQSRADFLQAHCIIVMSLIGTEPAKTGLAVHII